MKNTLFVFLTIIIGLFAWILIKPLYPTNDKLITRNFKLDSIKTKEKTMDEKIIKTEEEWEKLLSTEEYRILRQKGTERAFTGKYWDHHETGIYTCAGCGTELFESDTKFDSGCGWPSYFQPIDSSRIFYKEDKSYGMIRTEVMCAKCDGHLGHVFDDGPPPTGLRYCINSGSMNFISKNKK